MSTVFFKVNIPSTGKNAYVIIDLDAEAKAVEGLTFMNIVYIRVPSLVWSYPTEIVEVFLHELVHVKQFHKGIFHWFKRKRNELNRIEDEIDAYTESLISLKYGTYEVSPVQKLQRKLYLGAFKVPEKYFKNKVWDKFIISSFHQITSLTSIPIDVIELVKYIQEYPRDIRRKSLDLEVAYRKNLILGKATAFLNISPLVKKDR